MILLTNYTILYFENVLSKNDAKSVKSSLDTETAFCNFMNHEFI